MSTTLSPSQLQEDRGSYIIASVSPCLALAIIATVLRVIARRIQKTPFNASDYLIIPALVCACCEAALIFTGINYGFGSHVETVSPPDLETFLKVFFAAEIFYVLTISLTKFSILFLYCSLFPGKHFALLAKLIAAFVLAWAVACIFGVIFSCVPVQGFWDLKIPSKCIDSTKFFVGNAIPNIFTDVCILTLPMRKIWELQMTPKRKLVVSGMFLLGGFVIVASILRLVLLFNENLQDPTYGLVNAFTWSNIELDVAVLSASLPTLRPIFQRLMPSQFLTTIGSSKGYGRSARVTEHGYPLSSKNGTAARDPFEQPEDDNYGYSMTSVMSRGDTAALNDHQRGIRVENEVSNSYEAV